jgi:predicted methyltransferase
MTRMGEVVAGTNIADGIVQGGFWTRIASTEEAIHGGEGVVYAGMFESW